MAWTDGIAGNVFETAGTMSLGTQWSDGYGGDGVSLGEQADVRNGSYDYVSQAGGIVYQRDAIEAQQMGSAYPSNGNSWDVNAATLGISRLIDSVSRGYATANGMTPATYAGANGLTYANGQLRASANMGGMLPLLLIGLAVYLIAK
jgi:hypothetical protein